MAAELAELALRLTPPAEPLERRRRALDAARAQQAAGEWTRARELATDLLAQDLDGPLRARTLVCLPCLESIEEGSRCSSRPCRLRRTTRRCAPRSTAAWPGSIRFRQGFAAGLEHAHAALELAEELGDRGLEVEALAVLVALGCVVGDPAAGAHARRIRKLAAASPDPSCRSAPRRRRAMSCSTSMQLDARAERARVRVPDVLRARRALDAEILRRLA